MAKRRIHGRRKQTPQQAGREKQTREQFQQQRPSLKQLQETGEYTEPVSQGEYWSVRKTVLLLKSLREKQGLSLADVSERTGMDRAAISRLENGVQENPTVHTLFRYAKGLGLRLEMNVLSDEGEPISSDA